MASTPSEHAGSQESSLNALGTRENPVILNDDDDDVDEEQMPQKDSDSDSDYNEPLRQRLASESTIANQEPEDNVHQEEEPARNGGDHPRLSVSIENTHNKHGQPGRQAWFLKDGQTRYKMNVTNSFISRQEKRKLLRDWQTWNEKELEGEIAFLKFLGATKKKGKKAAKKTTLQRKRK